MKIHQLEVAEAFASLQSGPTGLDSGEAARRLGTFGPNRVERIAGPPAWHRLLGSFTHFFALILWVASLLAFLAELRRPGTGMATLGLAILGVIVVNGLFSFWQERRAERAILALERLLPREVKALRDGQVAVLTVEALVPGDIVLLEGGDNVPADCRVIEAFAGRVDNATVTGESVPQSRDAGPSAEESLLRARNVLLAGTSVVSGEMRALVFGTGMQTEFGRIAHLTQTAGGAESPLLREIRTLSRWVAVLATSLGAVFFVIGREMGLGPWENLVFAIGIIVANVPEGLLPTVTLSLAMGAQRLARRRAVVRELPAVETLGAVTVICTDKTGTLTSNRLVATRLYLGGRRYDVPHDLPDLATRHRRFFEVAGACHDLKRVGERWLGDPLEIALVGLAGQALPHVEPYPRIGEIPFDSERRRLSTLHRTSGGLVLYTKGALESLLPLSSREWGAKGAEPLDDARREEMLRVQAEMADDGLRVLALAAREEIHEEEAPAALEQSLTLLGLVGLEDPPRPEVPAAVATCRAAGIRVVMITGDHPSTAAAVARQIGLAPSGSPRILTGDAVARLSDAELHLALEAREILFARVAPEQKMRIVRVLKSRGEIVAVTGDGVNDAPALRLADIGIAMGQSGTDVARESADMLLLDDNFATIVTAIEEGRAVYDNIRKFLTYILTSNVPEIVPYLAFVLLEIPLALTVIQILAVDLGTDMLPALGLGADPPRAAVMARPPRRRTERLIDAGLLARAYLFLGPIEAAAAMAAFVFVLHAGGWVYGRTLAGDDPLYLEATTACLSAIVVVQVVNVLICRDARLSVFRMPLLENRLILAGIGVEIVLALLIVYTPVGNALFRTAPLDGSVWLFLLPFAAAMLVLEEGRKAVARRSSRPSIPERPPASLTA